MSDAAPQTSTRRYVCTVCGFPELTLPPTSDVDGGSFEICPCCYFQPGFDDEDRGITHEQARDAWIADGMPWRSQQAPPENWNPSLQWEAFRQSRQ